MPWFDWTWKGVESSANETDASDNWGRNLLVRLQTAERAVGWWFTVWSHDAARWLSLIGCEGEDVKQQVTWHKWESQVLLLLWVVAGVGGWTQSQWWGDGGSSLAWAHCELEEKNITHLPFKEFHKKWKWTTSIMSEHETNLTKFLKRAEPVLMTRGGLLWSCWCSIMSRYSLSAKASFVSIEEQKEIATFYCNSRLIRESELSSSSKE